jgi:hypothetical protein
VTITERQLEARLATALNDIFGVWPYRLDIDDIRERGRRPRWFRLPCATARRDRRDGRQGVGRLQVGPGATGAGSSGMRNQQAG